MPHIIVKLKDEKFNKEYYLMWSTIVDAPVTYGMEYDKFKEYYFKEYETKDFEQRMKRVEEKGTSSFVDSSVESLLSFNQAKEGETGDLEYILENYCRNWN